MTEPVIQAMLLIAAACVAAAFLFDRWGSRTYSVAAAMMAACALLVAIVAMAAIDIGGDPLSNCRLSGGAQMVHTSNGWVCVQPGEAG